jgi:hypothetical protein
MAKQKHKVARYQIALNEPQNEILKKMMDEDLQTDVSAYFGMILANEWKQREAEKAKRPVGRPRKEDEENEEEEEEFDLEKEFADDLPKNINWYGVKIGERQLKYYEDLQKGFKAK